MVGFGFDVYFRSHLKAWQSDAELPGALEGSLEAELLGDLLYDADASVRHTAVQSYVHWLAMPSRLAQLAVEGDMAVWSQFYPVAATRHERRGLLLALSTVEGMEQALVERLPKLGRQQGGAWEAPCVRIGKRKWIAHMIW